MHKTVPNLGPVLGSQKNAVNVDNTKTVIAQLPAWLPSFKPVQAKVSAQLLRTLVSLFIFITM